MRNRYQKEGRNEMRNRYQVEIEYDGQDGVIGYSTFDAEATAAGSAIIRAIVEFEVREPDAIIRKVDVR